MRISKIVSFGTGDFHRDALTCFDRVGRFPYAMAYAVDQGAGYPWQYPVFEACEQEKLHTYSLRKALSFDEDMAASITSRVYTIRLEPLYHGKGWSRRTVGKRRAKGRRIWFQMQKGGDWLALRECYLMDVEAEPEPPAKYALPPNAGESV